MSAPRPHRLSLPVAVFAIGALIALILSANRAALSYTDASPPVVKWVYNTTSADAGELQARLAEFGTSGWEVFAIDPSSQILEQDDDFRTRAIVERYQITGRRPASRQ
jgi:hypothetical protein